MFPLLFPVIGALGGALLSKKDPLKGALLGGALGAGGGLLAAPAAGSQAGMLAAQESGLGLGSMGWKGATTGVQGLLNNPMPALNTVNKAAQTAGTIKSLMPPEQPIPTAPAFTTGGGNTTVGGVYKDIQDARLAQAQAEMQRRMKRYGTMNLLG